MDRSALLDASHPYHSSSLLHCLVFLKWSRECSGQYGGEENRCSPCSHGAYNLEGEQSQTGKGQRNNFMLQTVSWNTQLHDDSRIAYGSSCFLNYRINMNNFKIEHYHFLNIYSILISLPSWKCWATTNVRFKKILNIEKSLKCTLKKSLKSQ